MNMTEYKDKMDKIALLNEKVSGIGSMLAALNREYEEGVVDILDFKSASVHFHSTLVEYLLNIIKIYEDILDRGGLSR